MSDVTVKANRSAMDGRSAVDARGQQLEDWLALGLFLSFLGGADAFVTAHLKEFPGPLGLHVAPAPSGGTAFTFKFPAGP